MSSPSKANEIQVGGDHYKSNPIQHWDFALANGHSYLVGQATKYLTRWSKKNGLEDLRKAVHFITKELERAEVVKEQHEWVKLATRFARSYVAPKQLAQEPARRTPTITVDAYLTANGIPHDCAEAVAIGLLDSWARFPMSVKQVEDALALAEEAVEREASRIVEAADAREAAEAVRVPEPVPNVEKAAEAESAQQPSQTTSDETGAEPGPGYVNQD